MSKSNLSVLFLVATILLMSSVSALSSTNLTLRAPASSAVINVNTSVLLNATLDSVNPAENWTMAYFYAKSSSTANSSWSLLATAKNNSITTMFNVTFNSVILEDSNDYTFNVTLINGSSKIDATTTSIQVNNSLPTTPASLSPSTDTEDTDGSVSFGVVVAGKNTTGCTLYFLESNPGQPSYTMTHSGDNCNHTLTDVPYQTYRWYITATDSSDTTANSAVNTILVNQAGVNKGAFILTQKTSPTTGKRLLSIADNLRITNLLGGVPIWVWIFLIIAVVVIVLIIKFGK